MHFLPVEMPPLHHKYINSTALVSPHYNYLFSILSSIPDGELTEDGNASYACLYLWDRIITDEFGLLQLNPG